MTTLLERELIAMAARKLESEGYDVVVDPARNTLPEFLRDFRPDAIAFRADGNLVLEVLTSVAKDAERANALNQLFDEVEGWKLRLVWKDEIKDAVQDMSVQLQNIAEKTKQITDGLTEDNIQGSFLLLWSVLEAISRYVEPEEFQRAQPSKNLVQRLASLGYVTPTQADELRILAELRNKLAHGGIDAEVSPQQLHALLDIQRDIFSLSKEEVQKDFKSIDSLREEFSRDEEE